MKRLLVFLIAAVAAALLGLVPFRSHDISKLLPVTLLVAAQTDGEVRVLAQGGLEGRGKTLSAALSDMKNSAPGELFLGTVEAAVFSDELWHEAVNTPLRRATEVYQAENLTASDEELSKLAVFLRAHPHGVTIGLLAAEDVNVPRLAEREGGFEVLDR